ncbi:BTAD domain-containing putative transcriptional regulator [Pseudobutyrivibrio sp. MD2005]|uniref:BTAD domain-containing putative transcriptional regulator n=1 Tax=Pseudobutyrivibrio sp. MD2005 TaxID=1410616 RepID=UPI0004889E7B|nr:BTAD domain-containing putative transcriptional regulator [Pseudobutyrivibrio sp. MD2005]
MSGNIVFNVKFLGTVDVKCNDMHIVLERNNTTKVNQLFQMLLYHVNGISRDQVIYNLFQNEGIADESNSLRAIVFRLRKALLKTGLPEEDYVYIKRGNYRITPNASIECDAVNFEELAKQALASDDADVQQKLLEHACKAYNGDFLPTLSGYEWVVTTRVRLKKLFDRCLKQLLEMYKVQKDYDNMYTLSHKANKLYPYDGWQTYEMEALIEVGKTKDALKLYEDTETLMFEELGVSVSSSMAEQLDKLGSQVINNSDMISEVKKNLDTSKEDIEGAFYCTYPIFVESYRYIKRVIRRSGQAAWLMLCTITDGKGYALSGSDRLETLAEELSEAIRVSARGGDMYARYSNNQFVVLLLGITQEDCVLVQSRINENMSKESRKRYIKYNLAPVNLASAGTDYDTAELQDMVRGEE